MKALHATFVLKACDLSAVAAGGRFARYFLCLNFANFVLELRKSTARTTFVLRSCDIAAGLAFHVLLAQLEVAIFKPELPRTRQVEPETTSKHRLASN